MVKTLQHEDVRWLSPRDIYEYLDQYVIGQERAKRTVAIAAYNHFKRIHAVAKEPPGKSRFKKPLLKKSNILMIGPTGCGKTHIARNLAEILEVPFTVSDATEYTEAGYYGKDVEVMAGELLYAADMDVEKAQQGIIFIDEVDKIARRDHGSRTGAGSRDIGGEGVQQALLKMLEGSQVFVPYNLTQHWNKHDFVQMDTTNILFICAGTFTDIQRGGRAHVAGFGQQEDSSGHKPLEQRVTIKDLMDYGMIAEFLGRVPVLVELDELSEPELLRIITEPPDSVLNEYKALLALDGIELDFTPAAFREIVAFAKKRKVGARGLRTIFEELMHDVMFDAPENRGERIVYGAPEVREKLSQA